MMAEINFRSMAASQNKNNVTIRFGIRDFVLPVCTWFIRKCHRFEVIRDFRSLNNGGITFRVDRYITEQRDVTNQVGDRDFVSALCTGVLWTSYRFEVIRNFCSSNSGRNQFPVDYM
jgi:hypothetical protein